MTDDDSDRPHLNAYGNAIVICVAVSGLAVLVDAPGVVSVGSLALAFALVWIAMHRNDRGRADEQSQTGATQSDDDEDSGTDDTEMKAKGMVGGAGGGHG